MHAGARHSGCGSLHSQSDDGYCAVPGRYRARIGVPLPIGKEQLAGRTDGGPVTATIEHLVQTYGYWAVFLAVGLESVGLPIPGETTLIAAALFAGNTHRLSLVYLVAVASVAAIAGDNLGYLIGRGGGYRLLRRYGHRVHVDEAKLKVG